MNLIRRALVTLRVNARDTVKIMRYEEENLHRNPTVESTKARQSCSVVLVVVMVVVKGERYVAAMVVVIVLFVMVK